MGTYPMVWLAILALVGGSLLIVAGRVARKRRGLTDATTVALDNRTLHSARLGLVGRPDRITRGNIPEEGKSSRRIHDSHRAQLAVYFLLIEEETGVRPPHGFIVTGGGRREREENTPELRAWVLGLAGQIRAARRKSEREIPVRQPPAKCQWCGMREGCGQRGG